MRKTFSVTLLSLILLAGCAPGLSGTELAAYQSRHCPFKVGDFAKIKISGTKAQVLEIHANAHLWDIEKEDLNISIACDGYSLRVHTPPNKPGSVYLMPIELEPWIG